MRSMLKFVSLLHKFHYLWVKHDTVFWLDDIGSPLTGYAWLSAILQADDDPDHVHVYIFCYIYLYFMLHLMTSFPGLSKHSSNAVNCFLNLCVWCGFSVVVSRWHQAMLTFHICSCGCWVVCVQILLYDLLPSRCQFLLVAYKILQSTYHITIQNCTLLLTCTNV